MNSRLISLSIDNQECTLLIEASGLGLVDTIKLSHDQVEEFLSLKGLLDEQNEQDRDLQNTIIRKFRSIQKMQEQQDSFVYAECQNSVDFG